MTRIAKLGSMLALALFAGATAQPAAAADPPPRAADPGAALLPAPVAWADGPSALDVNVAGLGFRPPFAAELGVASARASDGPVGLVGYAGTHGVAAGGQVQLSEGHNTGHAVVGAGFPVLSALSLGGAFRMRFPGTAGEPYGTWDLGLTLRPVSWLALAGAARDLARWRDHPGRHSPLVTAGIAIRPLGYRLSIALDWSYETAEPPDPHHLLATVGLEPVDGIEVFAAVDENARVGFGVRLSFRAGWIGGHARVRTRSDAGFDGWVAAVGATSATPRTRLALSRDLAEIELGGTRENPTVSPLAPRLAATRFSDVLLALHRLADERAVRAVLLRLDGRIGGLARAEELRAEIERLRSAGKPVYAYLEDGGGNVDYYVASACDRIWMHPAGTLAVTGLSSRLFFYRGSLDKLGVEAQFSRIGRYKSSPERFTETRPTAANLEARNSLLDDRFDRWLAAVAAGRGMEQAALRERVDDAPYPAALALEHGLVDGLYYPDEVREQARNEAGATRLGLRRPLHETHQSPHWRPPHTVAVIHVDGLINTGRSGRLPFGLLEVAGSETLARAIRDAREDRTVSAIVLRVDSPGGSAFASEAIWREVHRTRGVKPVVVSMASIAASGGYYVSCSADRILADPSTLTGSIGVYAGKISLGGLYDKLGVDSIQLRRGAHAGLYDMAEPWSPSEYRAIERVVDHLYADFVEHVREGRGVAELAVVDRVAQGRVWTGAQALEAGLVDELGGLLRAVEVARELAGIPERAEVELRPSPRVGLLTSLQLGKGFVAADTPLPGTLLPDELRWSLSGLMLMEEQGELATMTMAPVMEAGEE